VPTIRYNTDLEFIDSIKKEGVTIESFTIGNNGITIVSKNIGTFFVKKGNYLSLPPKRLIKIMENKKKWKVSDDEPLAKVFIRYTDDPTNKDKTFDDFLDDVGIPVDERNDFCVAAIIKQILQEIHGNENAE